MLVKTLLVVGLGALLGYFGLNIPQEQTEEVFDGAAQEVSIQQQSEQSTQIDERTYEVLSVIDGDTLRVTIDGESVSVRVLGINTPETEYSSRGAECFGAEASAYAKTLLEGASVQLASDDSQDIRDKYDRVLAYVTLPDGRDFGEVMITDGYAYEYTHIYPYKNQQQYRNAQKQAEENGVGLWADGACEG